MPLYRWDTFILLGFIMSIRLFDTLFARFIMLTVSMFLVTACASSSAMKNDVGQNEEISDPLEPVNRVVFDINEGLDTVLFAPLAKGYKAVVPEKGQSAIRNFLQNLASPIDLTNQLLQGDFEGAADVTGRFLLNTTFGLGGIFDIAESEAGIEHEGEDFGQTLAVWGVKDGPYVVLPVLGPSNLRDTTGLAVDTAGDPLNWYVNRTNRDWKAYTRAGLTGIDTKARLLDPMKELKQSSLDYYAAVRSIYKQFRDAQIKDQGAESFADSVKKKEDAAAVESISSYDAYADLDFADYDE